MQNSLAQAGAGVEAVPCDPRDPPVVTGDHVRAAIADGARLAAFERIDDFHCMYDLVARRGVLEACDLLKRVSEILVLAGRGSC